MGDDAGAALAGLDALVAEVHGAETRAGLASAIARRDTVLWARRCGRMLDVADLIAFESLGASSHTENSEGARADAAETLAHLAAATAALAQVGLAADGAPAARGQGVEAVARYLRLRRQCTAEAENEPGFARELTVVVGRTRELVTRLRALDHRDRVQVDSLGKASASSRRVHVAMQRWPIASIERVMAASGLRSQAATSALHRLRGMGVVRETTRRHRRRLYIYDDYIAILADDVSSWCASIEDAGS